MPVTRLARPCILFAAVAFLLSLCTPSSEALGRGGSSAMRAYMRMAQAQAKWMQAYQKQQKEQYDAFMKRFDTNRNG
ncbi:MAG TPA: hypothetical protein VFI31_00085, partial [Pirellulales bacterium]|nr:hypothetical protein [Pirellulales bacterium]